MPMMRTDRPSISPVVHRQCLRARRRRAAKPSRAQQALAWHYRRCRCCCRYRFKAKSVLARRSPCGRTPLEALARAQGARWMPRERLWPPLCCSPKLTHLFTAVPQDTVPHHLRSASRRGRHCMAPQEGLQSSQRRWRATAARYRRGRGAVQGILAHTLRRPCPRTPRRDPSSVLCPTARAIPLIFHRLGRPERNAHGLAVSVTGHCTYVSCHRTPVSRARG